MSPVCLSMREGEPVVCTSYKTEPPRLSLVMEVMDFVEDGPRRS